MSQPVLQSTHPTTICNVLQVFTKTEGLYKNRLCYARYEKSLKNYSLEVAKKYVETYSSSNAAALYSEERITKINLVTLLITKKIQWKQWYFTKSCTKNHIKKKKKKRKWSNLRLTDVEWLNFPAKSLNNPKLPCCHANLFNVPSEF